MLSMECSDPPYGEPSFLKPYPFVIKDNDLDPESLVSAYDMDSAFYAVESTIVHGMNYILPKIKNDSFCDPVECDHFKKYVEIDRTQSFSNVDPLEDNQISDVSHLNAEHFLFTFGNPFVYEYNRALSVNYARYDMDHTIRPVDSMIKIPCNIMPQGFPYQKEGLSRNSSEASLCDTNNIRKFKYEHSDFHPPLECSRIRNVYTYSADDDLTEHFGNKENHRSREKRLCKEGVVNNEFDLSFLEHSNPAASWNSPVIPPKRWMRRLVSRVKNRRKRQCIFKRILKRTKSKVQPSIRSSHHMRSHHYSLCSILEPKQVSHSYQSFHSAGDIKTDIIYQGDAISECSTCVCSDGAMYPSDSLSMSLVHNQAINSFTSYNKNYRLEENSSEHSEAIDIEPCIQYDMSPTPHATPHAVLPSMHQMIHSTSGQDGKLISPNSTGQWNAYYEPSVMLQNEAASFDDMHIIRETFDYVALGDVSSWVYLPPQTYDDGSLINTGVSPVVSSSIDTSQCKPLDVPLVATSETCPIPYEEDTALTKIFNDKQNRRTTSDVVQSNTLKVEWKRGFKRPLGKEGRQELIRKMRALHKQNKTKYRDILLCMGITFNRLSHSTVEELWQIAYRWGIFDFALNLAEKYGKLPTSDSQFAVQ